MKEVQPNAQSHTSAPPAAPPGDWFRAYLQSARSALTTQLAILGGLILLFWAIELLDQVVWRESLDFWGIEPRQPAEIHHIFFAPFLHKGFRHLLANTVPFFMLGWLVLLRGTAEFIAVALITTVISGAGIWLLGMPGTIHIGLSGVVFGFLGFLLWRGYFERSPSAVGLAVLVGLLYGSMIWGLLPLQPNVSWLGHLFGFGGGGVAAYLLARKNSAAPV